MSNPNESKRTFALTAVNLAAMLVAAFALLTSGQRAATIGLTRHGALITAQDAGAADAVAAVAVAPGTAGQVLTVSDAGLPHWAAAASTSGTLRVTRYYAADFTAEGGSETASISGTGVSSTATLTASATQRHYGTSGATAARLVLPIPAGAREVTATISISAGTGLSTSGFRWMGVALRNAADGAAPARLFGLGISDSASVSAGNLMGGANNGGTTPSGVSGAPIGASRSHRVTILPILPRVEYAAINTASPVGWGFPLSPLSISGTGVASVADTSSATALAVWLQSFTNGGATSMTFSVAVDVVTQ